MSCLRRFGGRRAALRERVTVRELCRTYGVLRPPRGRAMVPDPCDDYLRSDWHIHDWKRHRRTQYRPAAAPRPVPPHAAADYVGFARVPPIRPCRRDADGRQRYRVRQAYHRHRRPSVWTPAPSTLPPGSPPDLRKPMLWEYFLAARPELLAAIAAKRLRLRAD